MTEKLIVAGFGGQGVLFLGKLLAQAMMEQGHEVTYFPSYGPEVRGGKANCHVIMSSEAIFSPIVAQADTVIAMSQLSWDHFSVRRRPEGLAVVNSSMVAVSGSPAPGWVVAVPATEIANELGDVRATNMVMLGAYNQVRRLLPFDVVVEQLQRALRGRKADLFELNRRAVRRGAEQAAATERASR